MQRLTLLGTAGSVIVVLALVAWKVGLPRETPARLNLEQFNEQSPQFRKVELKALAGSVEAANALMDYHSKCHIREDLSPDLTPKRFKECSSKVAYWTTIALENGSLLAAQRHANGLLDSTKCSDIYRADFWFRKFRPSFSSDRVFLKSVSDQIAEKKQSCRW